MCLGACCPHPVRDSSLGWDPPALVTALGSLQRSGDARAPCEGGLGMLQEAELPMPGCSLLPPIPSPGISEDSKVEAPAFTDAIRMYRQSKEQYGTWDMLCGNETQVRTCPPSPRMGGAVGG